MGKIVLPDVDMVTDMLRVKGVMHVHEWLGHRYMPYALSHCMAGQCKQATADADECPL